MTHEHVMVFGWLGSTIQPLALAGRCFSLPNAGGHQASLDSKTFSF